MEKTIEMIQRAGEGKGEARKLRADNRIPGICYGKHLENPIPVSVDKIKIAATLRGSDANDLFTVSSEDSSIKGQLVVVKDKQTDPLSEDLLHIDFLAVNKDEPIKATVTIELIGKSKGVAEGGILQQPNRTLEIKCLPHKMPSVIEADVSDLAINDSLHVTDIKLPEGVEVVDFANRTLAVVVPPREEEEEPVEAIAADAVEVVGEKKEEEPAEGEKKE